MHIELAQCPTHSRPTVPLTTEPPPPCPCLSCPGPDSAPADGPAVQPSLPHGLLGLCPSWTLTPAPAGARGPSVLVSSLGSHSTIDLRGALVSLPQ